MTKRLVYLLTKLDGKITNRIYRLKDASKYVGAHTNKKLLEQLTADQLTPVEGCEAVFTKVNASHFHVGIHRPHAEDAQREPARQEDNATAQLFSIIFQLPNHNREANEQTEWQGRVGHGSQSRHRAGHRGRLSDRRRIGRNHRARRGFIE